MIYVINIFFFLKCVIEHIWSPKGRFSEAILSNHPDPLFHYDWHCHEVIILCHLPPCWRESTELQKKRNWCHNGTIFFVRQKVEDVLIQQRLVYIQYQHLIILVKELLLVEPALEIIVILPILSMPSFGLLHIKILQGMGKIYFELATVICGCVICHLCLQDCNGEWK